MLRLQLVVHTSIFNHSTPNKYSEANIRYLMFSSENDETSSSSALWLILVLNTGFTDGPPRTDTQHSNEFCVQIFFPSSYQISPVSPTSRRLSDVHMNIRRLMCGGCLITIGSTSSIYNFQAQDGADYTWTSSASAFPCPIMLTRSSSGRSTELQLRIHISCRFLVCLDLSPLLYSAVVTGLDFDVLVEG